MLVNAVIAALLNVVLIAGLPLLGYFVFHKWRHKRGFAEIAHRAGFRIGKPRYLGYGVLAGAASVIAIAQWPPPMDAMTREGNVATGLVVATATAG